MKPKNWICHWFGHATPDYRVAIAIIKETGMLISQCPRCGARLRKRADPAGSWYERGQQVLPRMPGPK